MLFIAIKVLVTKETSRKKSFVPAVGPGLGAVSQQHRSAFLCSPLSLSPSFSLFLQNKQ